MIYFQRKEINMSELLSMIGMQAELDYLIGDIAGSISTISGDVYQK